MRAALIAAGRLHQVGGAPQFPRRAYIVETAQTTGGWPWFEAAIAAVRAEIDR